MKGSDACSCAVPCAQGEYPCPSGQTCEEVTSSETGAALGMYCVPEKGSASGSGGAGGGGPFDGDETGSCACDLGAQERRGSAWALVAFSLLVLRRRHAGRRGAEEVQR